MFDYAFWKDNAHLSGEELARKHGGDGGSWRRRVRAAKQEHEASKPLYPDLSWYTHSCQGTPAKAPRRREKAPQRHSCKPSARRRVDVEKCVVVSDLHVPFHDERALSVALALIEDVKPEVLVFGGDVADFYAVSKFDKDPHRALMLQDEIDQCVDVLKAFRKAAPKARIVFVEGNHEARLRNYLASRAPELSGLTALDIRNLLQLDELGIEYVPSKGRSAYWRYGAIAIGHFNKVSKHSCFTEKGLVDDRRESLVQGHTHRTGDYFKRLPNGERLAGVGSGCLCELDPEYCTDPDWHHAVVVITKRTDSKRFHVEPVQIVDYEALYNDVLYSA